LSGGQKTWAQFPEYRVNCNPDSLENVLRTNPPSGVQLLNIYHNLSWCYLYADDYDKIAEYSRLGIALAEKTGSLYIAADLYNNLGVAYDYASKVDSAMLYFGKALDKIAQMEKACTEEPALIDRAKAFTYGSIANLYSVQGKTGEAMEYYFEALELFEKHRINNEIANVLGNIGATYLDIDNYEQAEIYLLRKEEICPANGA
jgi:tetratricopeptide (TPR) repeat protein